GAPATMADLPGLIAAAAELAPTAVAFAHGEHPVTYAELQAKLAGVAKAMGAAATPETLINVALAGLVPGILTALGGAGVAGAAKPLLAAAVSSDPDMMCWCVGPLRRRTAHAATAGAPIPAAGGRPPCAAPTAWRTCPA